MTFLPVFDIKLGIIIKKTEFKEFGHLSNFKKLFAVKSYHDDVFVDYLPSKLERGLYDGLKPCKIPVPVRTEKLAPIEKYQPLEKQLTDLEFNHPKGDLGIWK